MENPFRAELTRQILWNWLKRSFAPAIPFNLHSSCYGTDIKKVALTLPGFWNQFCEKKIMRWMNRRETALTELWEEINVDWGEGRRSNFETIDKYNKILKMRKIKKKEKKMLIKVKEGRMGERTLTLTGKELKK